MPLRKGVCGGVKIDPVHRARSRLPRNHVSQIFELKKDPARVQPAEALSERADPEPPTQEGLLLLGGRTIATAEEGSEPDELHAVRQQATVMDSLGT